MNRRSLTLLILLAAVVLLLIVYIVAVPLSENGSQDSETTPETVMAADFSYKDIVSISYSYDGQPLDFEYQNDSWFYVPDHDFPVNQTALSQMANAVASMQSMREIATSELDFSTVGLETPAYTIKVGYKDGSAYEYSFGDANSFSGYRYLTVAGNSDTVYMVDSTITDYFDFGLNSLAQFDTLPTLSAGDVTSYTVTYPDGQVLEVSDTTLLDSVMTLALQGCAGFKPTDEERVAYGLDDAQAVILTIKYNVVKEVTNESDSIANSADITVEYTMTLRVGKALSDDRSSYSYMMYNDSNMIYLVSTKTLDLLAQQYQNQS